MGLRIFLLLLVVKLVWTKVAKTGQAVDPEDESDPSLKLQELEHSSSPLDPSSNTGQAMDPEDETNPSLQLLHLDPSSSPIDSSSTTGTVMDSEDESNPSLKQQHLDPSSRLDLSSTTGPVMDPEDKSNPSLQLQDLDPSFRLDLSSTTGPVMDPEAKSNPNLQLQHIHLNHSSSKTDVSGAGAVIDQEDESDPPKELHHLDPTSPLDHSSSSLDPSSSSLGPSESPLDPSEYPLDPSSSTNPAIDPSNEKDRSLQHLDYSSSASSLNLIESDINILDEEVNGLRAKINDVMSEVNSETTEVIGETFENNENENRLNELTKEEQMNEEMEEISDKSKATIEEKPNHGEMGAAENTANNENLGKAIQHPDLEEKTRYVNDKPSSETLLETMEMSENGNNEIEFEQLNEEKDIIKMSIVDDKDEVMYGSIAEEIDAVATTMEEQMENKSAELIQELFVERKEDESHDTLILNSEVQEADAKFIEELKEKMDFLEEGMNKYTSRLNFHLVDLERKKDVHEKTESEDWTINENSIENPLRVETFSEVDLLLSDDLEKDHELNGKDLEKLENHVQVKEYSENENIDDQKYSMHPNSKEGVDLWFPNHKDDLQREEGSMRTEDNINDDENIGENVHDEKVMDKTFDEVTQSPDDVLVQKEAKIKPNIKLLLKRTGFWRETYEEGTSHKREVTVSWTMMLAGVPLMVLLLVLVVLMGIIFLNKTHKKPSIFMKSLNLWGNDYDRMQISAIKEPKYNKLK